MSYKSYDCKIIKCAITVSQDGERETHDVEDEGMSCMTVEASMAPSAATSFAMAYLKRIIQIPSNGITLELLVCAYISVDIEVEVSRDGKVGGVYGLNPQLGCIQHSRKAWKIS